jgi:hypothetical protein
MKATIDVPDELYRLVKAKSDREGKAVGELTVELYQHYVGQDEEPEPEPRQAPAAHGLREGRTVPSWFGAVGNTARAVTRHDMGSIRESIARGIARDRDL